MWIVTLISVAVCGVAILAACWWESKSDRELDQLIYGDDLYTGEAIADEDE